MNATQRKTKRGLPPRPKIALTNVPKMNRKYSNGRVNYSNSDIRIIEDFGQECEGITFQESFRMPDTKHNRSDSSNKKDSSKFFSGVENFSEKFTNLNLEREKDALKQIPIQEMNSYNLTPINGKEDHENRLETKFILENIPVSPKYKDFKLHSIYSDKNDLYTNTKFPQFESNSSKMEKSPSKKSYIQNYSINGAETSNNMNQLYDFIEKQRCITKSNASAQRLHLNYKQLQNKLQFKRKNIEFEFKANMTPKITTKARNIIRNPELFSERLYPYHKVNLANSLERSKSCKLFQLEPLNECQDIDDLYGNHQFLNFYRRSCNKSLNNYNFRPTLNKNSIKIASDMESSMVRLTKKKSKKEFDEKILNRSLSKLITGNNSLSIYGNILDLENSMNMSVKSSKSLVRTKALYDNALNKIENRKKLLEEKIKIENEEYKNYPYKPELVSNPSTRSLSTMKYSSLKSPDSNTRDPTAVYNRQSDWKRAVLTRQHSTYMKREKESEMMHTFKPQINKSFKTLDTEFMKKASNHMEHSVSYVRNRRKSLVEKERKSSHVKKYGENYQPQATIPEAFKLSETYSKQNLIKERVNNLITKRRELNTQIFFEFDDFKNPLYYKPSTTMNKKKKENTSYVKMYLDQNITPNFLNNSKIQDSRDEHNHDNGNIQSFQSEDLHEESFYFLNASKNKFNKLDITFDSKDQVIKALGNINEKFMNFN